MDLLALYLIIDIRSKIFDSNNPNMFYFSNTDGDKVHIVIGKDHGSPKCSYRYCIFQHWILIHTIVFLEQDVCHYFAMALCNVFHNAKLLLPIPICAK